MRKEDMDSVTISISLPRVFAQKSTRDVKNKRFKKRVGESSTINPTASLLTKYSLSNKSLLIIQDNTFEDLLLPYRLYEKNVAKIRRMDRMAIELANKYKDLFTELRNRLHVDDPPNDVQAVTDIDNGYFRYLNIRHQTKCIPLYKSQKFLYHKQILTKQEIGYRRDEVLNIDKNHRRQLKKHQECVQIYMEQVKQFDAFISEDYEKSVTCLRKSETLYSNLIEAKISELNNLASTQFSIQSKLIGIDYLYYQQQKFGRFLYYISPHSWRAKHRDFACSVEIEAKGFDLGTSSEEDTFNVIFENMKKECASGLIKPVLYFSQPGDLIKIFESTEKQQLHNFTHVAQLKPHTERFQKMIKLLKISIQNDTAFAAIIIKNIEKLLDFNEERASQLEAKFMKILYGLFYDNVGAIDVIQLQMNLEWCFERVFRGKSNTTIRSTAKALEDMYMKYTKKLELFCKDETKAAFKLSVAEEKDMMKKAYDASRKLHIFDHFEKSLMRAYANDKVIIAPLPVVKRSATRKTKVQQVNTVVRSSSQRQLSEAEIEYLRLFTDWTEKENPAIYLQSL